MNIEIKNLHKSYGSKKVLEGITLTIEKGMFGLLGPNGAGKTTLMRILTTLLPKSSGEVKILGTSIEHKKEIRKGIGYLPQSFSLYPEMNVYETLDYLALLSGIKNRKERKARIIDLLEKVNLIEEQKKRTKALSGGMKRRLGIAQALLHDPKVLIVDEPTTGLDPEERIRFRNLLCDCAKECIVLLSTHIVEDIEATCEKVAILNQGKLLFAGETKNLLKLADGKVWSLVVEETELENIKANYSILSTVTEREEVRVKLLSEIQPHHSAKNLSPSIEDAYVACMKGGGADVL